MSLAWSSAGFPSIRANVRAPLRVRGPSVGPGTGPYSGYVVQSGPGMAGAGELRAVDPSWHRDPQGMAPQFGARKRGSGA